MGDTRTHWNLYVDESGKFEQPRQAVVVAGLLQRPSGAGPTSNAIRKCLWEAAPDVPWPLHANRLRFPVLLALAVEARRELPVPPPAGAQRVSRDAGLDALADRAITLLRESEPDLLEKVREILRGPHRYERKHEKGSAKRRSKKNVPDRADLRYLNNRLSERDPRLYAELSARMRRLNALVEQILAKAQSESFPGQLPTGMLVVCGEHHDGDAIPAGTVDDSYGSERYDNVLAGTFRRLHELLEHLGGRHLVWLHVLERRRVDDSLGPDVKVHVNPKHVGAVADGVCGDDPDDNIRLLPGSAPRFDSRVDPLLVLADFAANRCLHVLRSRRIRLRRAETVLRKQIGAVLRVGSPPLPAIAAVRGEPCPDGGGRRWAEEQAAEWRPYVAAKRAEQAS